VKPADKVPPTWGRGWVGIALRADRIEEPPDVSDVSDAVSPMSSLYCKPRENNRDFTSETSETSDAPDLHPLTPEAQVQAGIFDPFSEDDSGDSEAPATEDFAA
jgi:hypothetical protein